MRRAIQLLLLLACWPSPALAALDPGAVARLASEDSEEKIAAIRQLVQGGDPAIARLLQALSEEGLQTSGGRVLLVDGERVLDAATGEEVKPAPEDREPITVNNRVRRELGAALAALRLFDPDRRVRRA